MASLWDIDYAANPGDDAWGQLCRIKFSICVITYVRRAYEIDANCWQEALDPRAL
jgi:hypothetical protein